MIRTTAGTKESRAVNAEIIKMQLHLQLLLNPDNGEATDIIRQIIEDIDSLPTLDTINGKKVRKAYYPRIMVVDNCSQHKQPFQIGDNTHHLLTVQRGENSSFLEFENLQNGVGTSYASEGYSFVGEKLSDGMYEHMEIVPFDEVWVEEQQ